MESGWRKKPGRVISLMLTGSIFSILLHIVTIKRTVSQKNSFKVRRIHARRRVIALLRFEKFCESLPEKGKGSVIGLHLGGVGYIGQ